MCLLFVGYEMSPSYKYVIAANRDEFLERPTAPLGFFDPEKTILAGKDLQGGGTWLGVSQDLRIAAITNYRDGKGGVQGAPSRGEIIPSYLNGSKHAGTFLEELSLRADRYHGFNLVVGGSDGLFYYSNKKSQVEKLAPGFYGLSNHQLETSWPKVIRGKTMLRSLMVGVDRIDEAAIFKVLSDQCDVEDSLLPDTGVGIVWERLLSTIFIDSKNYGTRSSAVITITHQGVVDFFELSHIRQGGGQIYTHLVKKGFKV